MDETQNGGISREGSASASEAVLRLEKRLEAEPRHKTSLLRLLSFCDKHRTVEEVEQEMLSYPEMRVAVVKPRTMLSWMIESGGIVEKARTKDPSCHAWPERSFQTELPAELEGPARGDSDTDTIGNSVFLTTAAGKEALLRNSATLRINRLLDEDGAHAREYAKVLEACEKPQSKQDIDRLLFVSGEVMPERLPSYYTDKLERAGGLMWDGGWKTTDAGRTALKDFAFA